MNGMSLGKVYDDVVAKGRRFNGWVARYCGKSIFRGNFDLMRYGDDDGEFL
jgi:hypothetical protein